MNEILGPHETSKWNALIEERDELRAKVAELEAENEKLSSAVPEYLPDPPKEEVEEKPRTLNCPYCETEFTAKGAKYECPKCGTTFLIDLKSGARAIIEVGNLNSVEQLSAPLKEGDNG